MGFGKFYLYMALFACHNSMAVAPYEDELERLEINYKNGASIALLCRDENCGLRIKVDGNYYDFSRKDMDGVPAYSSRFRPILYSNNSIVGQFSFQIQLECESSGFPKGVRWPCFGNYLVVDGKIEVGGINKYVLKDGVMTPLGRL